MALIDNINAFLLRVDQSIRNKIIRRSIKRWEVADRFKEVTDLIMLAQFIPGPDGRSAYQVAVEDTGYVGTVTQWIASLKGEKGDIGADGRIVVAGEATNLLSGLVNPTPADGNEGDFWINTTTDILYGPKAGGVWPPIGIVLTGANGKSAYELAVDYGYAGDITQWLASLTGPKGDPGFSAYQIALNGGYVGSQADWLLSLRGPSGQSAYELAVAGGYVGTEAQWITSLHGAKGLSAYELAVGGGYDGTQAQWIASLHGLDGKSAYELAVIGGFVGTEAEWLLSLKGADGKSAYQLAIDNGYTGTVINWLNTIQGQDGLSAYELAVLGGFVGSEAQWLLSLKGTDGKSTYQLALDNGYTGTVTDWLTSIQGVDGKSAYELAVIGGFAGTEAEWLESLKSTVPGPVSTVPGPAGPASTVPGPPGPASTVPGPAGKSAYELAVLGGFVGTEAEWLASLGADFTELNRDDAFTVVGATDNEVGTLTSDGDKALQLRSAEGEVMFQVSPLNAAPAVEAADIDIAWSLDENTPDLLDLNLHFRTLNEVSLSNHTVTGTGLVGDGGIKPKSGAILKIELSYEGGLNGGVVWDGPTVVTLDILKNGVWFDGFTKQYAVPPATGSLGFKYIKPVLPEIWTAQAKIRRFVEPVIIKEPPVAIATINMATTNTTISAGLATIHIEGDQSYSPDGSPVVVTWEVPATTTGFVGFV